MTYSFNTSLLKSINFLKKRKHLLTPNIWIALYIVTQKMYIFFLINAVLLNFLFIQRILKNNTGPEKKNW